MQTFQCFPQSLCPVSELRSPSFISSVSSTKTHTSGKSALCDVTIQPQPGVEKRAGLEELESGLVQDYRGHFSWKEV